MRNLIIARENEPSSIEKLAAQRQLYSIAKSTFYIQTFIATISLVLLSFSQLFFPKIDLNLLIAIWSLLALFLDIILEKYIDNLKQAAAKIQELFDTYVLQIEWNRILCSDKPEYNEICRYYERYKKHHDLSNFSNWYEVEIASVSGNTGTLICQKTNCNYDIRIRQKYKGVVLWIGIITILSLLGIAIYLDTTLAKLVLTVLFPAAPIIQWAYKNISNNSESISNLSVLNSLLNDAWTDAKSGLTAENSKLRQIQDGIYLNRKGNPLIPDFIYNKLRNKLEAETYYSVGQLVREIHP